MKTAAGTLILLCLLLVAPPTAAAGEADDGGRRPVRVGLFPGFEPEMFLEPDGTFAGIIPDFLKRVQERADLEFELVTAELTQIRELIETGAIDAFPGMRSPERDEFLDFTEPIFTVAWVVVTPAGLPMITGLGDLHQARVAVVEGIYIVKLMAADYPEMEFRPTPDHLSALRMVAEGLADAYVGPLTVAGYLIQKHRLTPLRIAAPAGYPDAEVRLGVRKGAGDLVSTFNAAIRSIPRQAIDAINRRWNPVRYEHGLRRRTVFLWLVGMAAVFGWIIGMVLIWNRRLAREVARRERAEGDLLIREHRYEVLFSAITDGLFVHEVHGDGRVGPFIEVNEAACKLVGYDRETLMTLTPRDLEAPDAAVDGERITTQLAGGEHVVFDIDLVTRTGDRVPVEIRSRVFQMEGRSMVVSLVRDITDRREAELARRKSESRLSAMIAHSPLGIAFVDGEGRLFECNSALTEMVGYPRTQLLGESFEGFTHPDDLKREWELIRKTWDGVEMSYRMEKRYIHRDGRTFWVDVLSTVLPDHQGRPECAFAFVQDITDRRRAAEALRESEERYRTLFNMSNDAIFFYDIDPTTGRPGWFMEANETACRWLGYTREELLARGPMEITVPGYPYNANALREDLLLRRRTCFDMGIAGRDGRVIDVEANARAFDYGELLAVLVVARNITDRKQLEATLRKARDAAEAANQAKGNFLSNMSHELRTPLNAILGYAQILLGQEGLDDYQRDAVRVMATSGEHLLTLITDILDISKIEAGKMVLSADVFNLRQLLADLVDLIQLRARERGIHLVFSVETRIPDYMIGDEKRLRRILLNLLSNAVKFTLEGEVALRVTSAGEKVAFSVSDTGIGIPEDQREAVFKPFVQIRGGDSTSEGTGLGLTISRELVTLMGGDLKMVSREGEGTTFTFRLPLPPASGPGLDRRQLEGEITGYAGSRRRVLVVDDVADNRDILTALLTPLGFEITSVDGGTEALAAAEAVAPDIVLMDLVMPGMDGYEAIARLRRLPGVEGAAILAVSADVSQAARQGAVSAGADGFVPKPVFRTALLREMASVAGVEWLRTAPQEPPVEDGETALVPPPPDEIERLHQAARIGDLAGVRAAAEAIMVSSPESAAFCGRVLDHVRQFEIGRLKALISQYRENAS